MGAFLDFLVGTPQRKVDVYIIETGATYRANVVLNRKLYASVYQVVPDDDEISQIYGYKGYTVEEARILRKKRTKNDSFQKILSDVVGEETVFLRTREEAVKRIQHIVVQMNPTELHYHYVTEDEYTRLVKPKIEKGKFPY